MPPLSLRCDAHGAARDGVAPCIIVVLSRRSLRHSVWFLTFTGWPSALPCVARRSQATQDHHKEAVDAIGDDAPAAKEAKREKKAKKEKKSKSKAEAESAGDADAGAAGAEGKLLTAKERRKLFNKMRRYALSIDDATLCSERR